MSKFCNSLLLFYLVNVPMFFLMSFSISNRSVYSLSYQKDYGFLDTSKNNIAYDIVAQQILGKRRILEGVGAGSLMSESNRQNTLDELRQTTIEEDRKLLEGETSPSLVSAYNYRIGVKNALLKYGAM